MVNKMWSTQLFMTLGLLASVTNGQYISNQSAGNLADRALPPGQDNPQDSTSRDSFLISHEDFCLFGPPDPFASVKDSKTTAVSWCSKKGHNTRLIPDGTLHGVTYVKTDNYVQVSGWGDFTKINIAPNDKGGQIDSSKNVLQGATLKVGDPNNPQPATTWLSMISANNFCVRACTGDAKYCPMDFEDKGCVWYTGGQVGNGDKWQDCESGNGDPPSAGAASPVPANCKSGSSVQNGQTPPPLYSWDGKNKAVPITGGGGGQGPAGGAGPPTSSPTNPPAPGGSNAPPAGGSGAWTTTTTCTPCGGGASGAAPTTNIPGADGQPNSGSNPTGAADGGGSSATSTTKIPGAHGEPIPSGIADGGGVSSPPASTSSTKIPGAHGEPLSSPGTVQQGMTQLASGGGDLKAMQLSVGPAGGTTAAPVSPSGSGNGGGLLLGKRDGATITTNGQCCWTISSQVGANPTGAASGASGASAPTTIASGTGTISGAATGTGNGTAGALATAARSNTTTNSTGTVGTGNETGNGTHNNSSAGYRIEITGMEGAGRILSSILLAMGVGGVMGGFTLLKPFIALDN